MTLVLFTLALLCFGLATVCGWFLIVEEDPTMVIPTGLGVLGAVALSFLAFSTFDDTLSCETLVETKVVVGDIEICVPTPDAVDLVERYEDG